MKNNSEIKETSVSALRRRMIEMRASNKVDPLHNPVRRLASELFADLEADDISVSALGKTASHLYDESFEMRAAAFHNSRSRPSNAAESGLSALDGLPFDDFKKRVERSIAGVVFTAHPTFALGEDKRNLIAEYPGENNTVGLEQWRERCRHAAPKFDTKISLEYEHQEAQKAIANAQLAIRTLFDKILKVAQSLYRDNWAEIAPNPVSLASWVGYDLDGRTDIHWSQSIRFRLEEKAAQLRRYAKALKDISTQCNDSALKNWESRIRSAAELTSAQAKLFDSDLRNPEMAAKAANALTRAADDRLVSLKPAISALSQCIDDEQNLDLARDIAILRSEMIAYGLGTARMHLRVNAAQVRSALKSDLGLDPDRDFGGRSALDVASKRAEGATQRDVNFGSVFVEQMTARRQFMLCAQILKHIDADTPIRFLIAECEAPATVMGAIYLARLYGVEQNLDISPLFETPQAMEKGGRFIERLLGDQEYCDYIRARGRMAIQIGFSDSGRFMGQCTASMAAERLQILFAKWLESSGIGNVEALIFNTHGESMGRGAHPGDFRERLDHLLSPWVRSRFQKANINLNSEFSFQGGEGYLHFQTPEIAKKTVDMLWGHESREHQPDYSDLFYKDINFSWDIYRAIKFWQETLYAREDYKKNLFSFAQNLLFKTGSRESKRSKPEAGLPEIRSLRAIPHNAVLQQIACPSNVSGGIGAASEREMDRFIEQINGSDRMKGLIRIAYTARQLTSITVLRSYADIYSPPYWSALAGNAGHSERSYAYEAVLQVLKNMEIDASVNHFADYLAQDLRVADELYSYIGENIIPVDDRIGETSLFLLHALRQTFIAKAVSLIAGVPSFSRRHDIDREYLINLGLQVQIEEVAEQLREIFPKENTTIEIFKSLEEQVSSEDIHAGAYPEVHTNVIQPLDEIARHLTVISRAISNHYRAFG